MVRQGFTHFINAGQEIESRVIQRMEYDGCKQVVENPPADIQERAAG